MFSRSCIAIGLSLLVALVFAVPAFAGGWAVITLDELPTNVVAGEPLTVGFTVLQHGKTPLAGLYPTITAKLSPTETMVASAEPEGETGHYVATLTFPREGDWEWSIRAFTMDQPMPVLTVAAAGAAMAEPAQTEPAAASISPLLIFRALIFGLALVGMVIVFRRKSRLAVAFTGLCLLVGAGTFMMGAATPEVEAQSKESSEASISQVEQVEMGRQLFIAKGCITCHVNNKAASGAEYWTVEMGATNLSNFSASPEVLFIRLKDPAAAKSDTKMPNLGLKETEIEALIAFINSK